MEKLSVMPQTIYKFCCEDSLVEDVFLNLQQEKWGVGRHNYPFQTDNKRLDKEEKYSKLYIWFLECLNQVKDDLNLSCDEFKITQSWGNKASSNQWHHRHSHPNSMISGIFYLVDSDAETWFSVDNMWSASFRQSNLLLMEDKAADTIYKQLPVSGELLIFPSTLHHSVGDHREKSDRYTISFNSFPQGKIGFKDSLSFLEVKIL